MEAVMKDAFLQTAEQIAAKICRDAIWAGRRCNWLGDAREYVAFQPAVVHAALGSEVYGGTSGIALFLGRIFKQTNERIFRITAEGAITQSLSRIDDIRPETGSSYYAGRLGVAQTAVQIGTLLNNEALIEAGLSIAIDITKLPVDTQMLDVISGSASGILTFLNLFEQFGREEFFQAAIQHGEHLLKHAVKDTNGYSWQTISAHEASRNLCGLAHGAGGIGLGLLENYSATKDERYLTAAQEAIRYEQNWFNEEEGNYPDFRISEASVSQLQRGPGYMMAWCHGAPGIGIARVRSYELSHDETYRKEAERAAETTIRHLTDMSGSHHNNYSLCHGMSGNALFLLYAGRVFQNETYRQVAHDVGIAGIEQYPKQRLPWACGVLEGGETPNLMLGTAGIGHFYLSLYNEGELPPLWQKMA